MMCAATMKRPADLYDDLMKRERASKFSREGIFGLTHYIYDVYKRELTEEEMDDILSRSQEIIDRNYKEKLPQMNGYKNWNDFREAFHVVGIPSWNWVLAIKTNEFEKKFDWDEFLFSRSPSLAKLKEESDKWKREHAIIEEDGH